MFIISICRRQAQYAALIPIMSFQITRSTRTVWSNRHFTRVLLNAASKFFSPSLSLSLFFFWLKNNSNISKFHFPEGQNEQAVLPHLIPWSRFLHDELVYTQQVKNSMLFLKSKV